MRHTSDVRNASPWARCQTTRATRSSGVLSVILGASASYLGVHGLSLLGIPSPCFDGLLRPALGLPMLRATLTVEGDVARFAHTATSRPPRQHPVPPLAPCPNNRPFCLPHPRPAGRPSWRWSRTLS